MRYSYKNALQLITEWAKKEGYSEVNLNYNDVSYINWDLNVSLNKPKIIEIEGKYPTEIQVYLLLHELGHHQLRKDWSKYEKTLPIVAKAEHEKYYNNELKYKRRIGYSVESLEEEFKAWDEGYKLANKLGIKINLKKWNLIKVKCMLLYIRYHIKK